MIRRFWIKRWGILCVCQCESGGSGPCGDGEGSMWQSEKARSSPSPHHWLCRGPGVTAVPHWGGGGVGLTGPLFPGGEIIKKEKSENDWRKQMSIKVWALCWRAVMCWKEPLTNQHNQHCSISGTCITTTQTWRTHTSNIYKHVRAHTCICTHNHKYVSMCVHTLSKFSLLALWLLRWWKKSKTGTDVCVFRVSSYLPAVVCIVGAVPAAETQHVCSIPLYHAKWKTSISCQAASSLSHQR